MMTGENDRVTRTTPHLIPKRQRKGLSPPAHNSKEPARASAGSSSWIVARARHARHQRRRGSTQAYLHMSHILTEYVHSSLGNALNSLYVNLLNIKTIYPRMKTSALCYVTQQRLGRLRQMDAMPSQAMVAAEVASTLRLVEGSPMFQPLINRELMGMDV